MANKNFDIVRKDLTQHGWVKSLQPNGRKRTAPLDCSLSDYSFLSGTNGAVLSDKTIQNCMKDGSIIITPFEKENLTNCAYDITLGNKVAFVPDAKEVLIKGWVSTSTETPVIDISDKDSIYSSFKKIVFTEADKGVTIPPGGMMICHSNEFIGTSYAPSRPSLTTFMRARSTVARSGITISSSAGWGDVGYANRWGMVVHNTRKDASVFIPFGMKIAQIVFIRIEGIVSQCYSTLSGNYKTVAGRKKNFKKLDEEWDPESLIPKKKVIVEPSQEDKVEEDTCEEECKKHVD